MTEAAVRRPSAEEDPSRIARGPVCLEITGESLAHIIEQGQAISDQTLPPDNDLPLPPAQVTELESDDLTCAKAQSGEEQQDGAVSTSGGR
jgi:hypothetical protein